MNALATVIAGYGLLSNSSAVVIGAMVVAMMLGPIAGVALGLTDKDRGLLTMAFLSLIGGIAWILAVAALIGTLHRDAPLTAEILSRTRPTLFDLMIALAGGAAGAIATVSPRIGTAIVGVAIATALVPPLAATGILLARGDLDLAWNAFVLVLTNVVAIQFAFSFVLWFSGYRGPRGSPRGFIEFLRRDLFDVVVLAALAIVLGVRLHYVVSTALYEAHVRTALKQTIGQLSGAYVAGVRFEQGKDGNLVQAVVRGPDEPSSDQVAAMTAALPPSPDGRSIELRIRFVKLVIVTAHGRLSVHRSDAGERD